MFSDAVYVVVFRKGSQQADGMAEIMAEPCSLTHMLLQGMVLMGLYFQKPGAFFQRRMFQYNDGSLVKEQINCYKHSQRHTFEYRKKPFHPACV